MMRDAPMLWALAALLATVGCGNGGESLRWEVAFSEPALADRLEVLDARILRGGCDGTDELYRASTRRGALAPSGGRLPNGRYGLIAFARDESCTVYAMACADVRLPLAEGEGVALVLRPSAERAECEPSACSRGLCGDMLDVPVPDSAVPDTSGPPDVGPVVMDESCVGVRRREGSCYRKLGRRQSWSRARTECLDWGGDLVTLDDDAEQAFVLEHVADMDRFWLGLNDREAEMSWRWSSGSTASFRSWAEGEPNDGSDGSDCAEYRAEAGAWFDQDCELDKRAVCER